MRLEGKTEPIQFVNIYNAPLECERAGKAVTDLIRIAGLMEMATIVVGDFNLHHIDRDNRTIKLSGLATEVADWVASNRAIYALDQGIITYNRIGTIDLSIFCTAIESNLTSAFVVRQLSQI